MIAHAAFRICLYRLGTRTRLALSRSVFIQVIDGFGIQPPFADVAPLQLCGPTRSVWVQLGQSICEAFATPRSSSLSRRVGSMSSLAWMSADCRGELPDCRSVVFNYSEHGVEQFLPRTQSPFPPPAPRLAFKVISRHDRPLSSPIQGT